MGSGGVGGWVVGSPSSWACKACSACPCHIQRASAEQNDSARHAAAALPQPPCPTRPIQLTLSSEARHPCKVMGQERLSPRCHLWPGGLVGHHPSLVECIPTGFSCRGLQQQARPGGVSKVQMQSQVKGAIWVGRGDIGVLAKDVGEGCPQTWVLDVRGQLHVHHKVLGWEGRSPWST